MPHHPISPIYPNSSSLITILHPATPHLPSPSSLHPSLYQDHDKTQEEVLKHQASISQLKRSFMEAPPPSPPQPNQWEKRLTSSPATAIRVQQQQAVRLAVRVLPGQKRKHGVWLRCYRNVWRKRKKMSVVWRINITENSAPLWPFTWALPLLSFTCCLKITLQLLFSHLLSL